jgi:hypothetical protein
MADSRHENVLREGGKFEPDLLPPVTVDHLVSEFV